MTRDVWQTPEPPGRCRGTDPLEVWLDKLNSLASADEVRDLLVAERVTGSRHGTDTCPLAELFRRRTDAGYLFVFRTQTQDRDRPPHVPPTVVRRHAHARHVSEFVRRFDEGDYPELVRKRGSR